MNAVPWNKNPIEELAGSIQKLPAEIRWLHSSADAIQAQACKTAFVMGPRTRVAALILRLAALPALARLVACLCSFVLLLGAYVRQGRRTTSEEVSASIFVGIGALREREL